MIKLVIVDDHALVRLGIKRLLSDVEGIEVIAEAETGEDALRIVKETTPNIVLLDVNMPGIGGLETTRRLSRMFPSVKIIALTACHEEPYPSRLLQAGAAGFLTKESGLEEMVTAIKKVSAGQRYLSPEIAEQLAFKNVSELPDETAVIGQLTDREMQVLLMISTGVSVPEISKQLCLSGKTINTYRYRMFEKLNIKNDVELTHFALRHNLIEQNFANDSAESNASTASTE